MDGVLDLAERLDRRLKSGTVRKKTVGTRVSLSEEKELVEAADKGGQNLSEWVREVLLREARRTDDDALFTELVATRMLLVNLIKPLIVGQPVSPEWVAEAMAEVRKVKHKAAQAVRQQYATEAARAAGGR